MKTTNIKTSRPALTALLLGVVMASPAIAANKAENSEMAARYQKERSDCMVRTDAADRALCLKDASAAYAEARRIGLSKVPADYQANRLSRCEALPADDRIDCVARMRGAGSSSGSVDSGGIYRELVTIEAGQAPAPKSVKHSPKAPESAPKN